MIDANAAQRLLDARRAHYEKDWYEVYHQIYMIASEYSDDPYNPWKGLEEIAATAEKGLKQK